MQQQLPKVHVLGADRQLYLHPLAAQVEDHRLRVVLNAAHKLVFHEAGQSGVRPNAQFLAPKRDSEEVW